ncbi:MAG: DEAD/DEAH box helicase [Saprospiraceae bacterium]
MSSFKDLGLREDLLRAVTEMGFETPTPVQELVIPTALTSNGDIIALAQTGTGKTAAFGLPLLQQIDLDARHVQALVLCPTRELCVQVAGDLTNYSKYLPQVKVVAVYGGAGIDQQIRAIKSGAQIVVATPGRLVDLIERKAVKLENVVRAVLDEADEMLDMGFKDSLDFILGNAENRQTTWLFSATMSREVRSIAEEYMKSPLELSTGKRNQTNENIEHVYYVCRPDDKYAALKRIVDYNPGIYGLIFCRTKAETKEIADQMMRDGYNSDALHGDLAQGERDRAMGRFRDRSLQLLIATDVAARGIDVSDISHVINYGLPDEPEVYTHRSGRTGRAGKTGVSLSIITPKFESRIREIERITKASFTKKSIPTGREICEKQLLDIVKNIHEQEVHDAEIEPFLPKIYAELEDLTKEELIKRFASVEFNRFLAYYRNAIDINIAPKGSPKPLRGEHAVAGAGKYVRYFVNIGDMDGLEKRDFLKLMTKRFGVPGSALGRIDIKRSFTHFDIEQSFAQQVARELGELTFNGRPLRVNEADDKPEKKPKPKKEKVWESEKPWKKKKW